MYQLSSLPHGLSPIFFSPSSSRCCSFRHTLGSSQTHSISFSNHSSGLQEKIPSSSFKRIPVRKERRRFRKSFIPICSNPLGQLGILTKRDEEDEREDTYGGLRQLTLFSSLSSFPHPIPWVESQRGIEKEEKSLGNIGVAADDGVVANSGHHATSLFFISHSISLFQLSISPLVWTGSFLDSINGWGMYTCPSPHHMIISLAKITWGQNFL